MTVRNNKGQFVKGENIADKKGERYGRLVVTSLSDKKSGRKSYWDCVCDCGNKKTVRSDSLGRTLSCGCLKKEQDIINLSITNNHGLTYHPAYARWSAMIQRCTSPKSNAFKDYGGRGIKVCEDWLNPVKFIKWADDSGFHKKLTLERKDVNGDYTPENCEWVPMEEQHYNKRSSVYHTYNGETLTTMQWVHKYNIPIAEAWSYKSKKIPFTDIIKKYQDNTEVTD